MGTLSNATGMNSHTGVWCWGCRTDQHAARGCPRVQRHLITRKERRMAGKMGGETETADTKTTPSPGRRKPGPKRRCRWRRATGRRARPPAVLPLQPQLADLEGKAGRIRRALAALQA